MRVVSTFITVTLASILLAGPSVADSAFSRRHPRRTSTPDIATRAKSKSSHKNGQATYYNVEENTGACGEFHNNGEYVAAIGRGLWDRTIGNQGTSTMCGQTVSISWQGNNVEAKVVDCCEGCDDDSLDLSPTAFSGLADKDAGRLQGVAWKLKN